MCGICGIVGSENQPETAARMRRMLQAQVHRGPDGEGMFVTARAAIGMRRLSIIDLPGGQQPIWNETGTLALVFNGEIYNFQELRRDLETGGHVFRTKSDTETIVHAYEEWGRQVVEHLRGMFALAIVELPQGKTDPARRVFLARDPTGIKPLYYGFADGQFLFASEVRALLASGCFARRLCRPAVSSYLSFGAVGEPLTLIEAIRSVPPGHSGYVSCDQAARPFRPEPYWTVGRAMRPVERDSRQSPAVQVRRALEDAVHSHLVADVPLGIFLSSGTDSTAIAALASKHHPRVKTFTVAFSEEEFSEGAAARQTAQRLGTDHAEFVLSGEEMRRRLDQAVRAFDQPSMDGINTYFVSWAARQAGLKVALSGLGSDEIFGGYPTFAATPRMAALLAWARYAPRGLRGAISRVVLLAAARSERPDAVRKASAAFLDPRSYPHPYFFTRALFPPPEVARLLPGAADGPDSEWRLWLLHAANETRDLDPFTSVSWLETRSYLASLLLRDTDTMSMCHSLEVRVPFLDAPLVGAALRCPPGAKGTGKALLLDALGDLLPPRAARQAKRTFALPWEVWLRGPLRSRVESALRDCDAALASVIDIAEVQRVWDNFLARRTSWSRPWALFVLNEWAKRNLTHAPDAGAGVEPQARASVVL